VSGIDLATLEGKHCLLVEDIIDTGTTMSHLLPFIKSQVNTNVFSILSHAPSQSIDKRNFVLR
jgi:hypoxanthine phosphoribosyltransferase